MQPAVWRSSPCQDDVRWCESQTIVESNGRGKSPCCEHEGEDSAHTGRSSVVAAALDSASSG